MARLTFAVLLAVTIASVRLRRILMSLHVPGEYSINMVNHNHNASDSPLWNKQHYSSRVSPAKQQVMLSDSFLPVAMQVIAHLTDQMTFETNQEPPKTTGKPPVPNRPASAPAKPVAWPSKPVASPNKPVASPSKPGSSVSKPSTNRPMYVTSSSVYKPSTGGWWMSYTTARYDQTTPSHGPGLFAPVAPPSAGDRVMHTDHFLLPMDHNAQYTVIEPVPGPTEAPLLSLEQTDIKPLVEPKPARESLLPPSFPQGLQRTAEDRLLIDEEELSEENLQYLSPTIRDMLKLAYDLDDDRLVADSLGDDRLVADSLDDIRAGEAKPASKGKLSQSNLRLQLLYDLLSREAKKLRLSDYGGFSDAVMRELSAPADARTQLSLALSRMIERKDCTHDYANNRAREMVAELAKPETIFATEVGRLQPLVYRL